MALRLTKIRSKRPLVQKSGRGQKQEVLEREGLGVRALLLLLLEVQSGAVKNTILKVLLNLQDYDLLEA